MLPHGDPGFAKYRRDESCILRTASVLKLCQFNQLPNPLPSGLVGHGWEDFSYDIIRVKRASPTKTRLKSCLL